MLRPSAVLTQVYDLLLCRYGPQHWWPAEEPFEVIVGAILTQSAAWSNVEKAIGRLKEAGVLSVSALDSLPVERLAHLVYPSGYYNSKARKLQAFTRCLNADYGGDLGRLFALDTPALRERLLSLHGIGEETADSILLYAAGRPVFVVDAYTRRVFHRLGLMPAGAGYGEVQALLMTELPHRAPLFNEYHALLVRHGKDACRQRPRCEGCVLDPICDARDRSG